jgi:hypothetical protein
MTEERKPAPDRGIVEALGLLLHARAQAEHNVEMAVTIGWIRVAEIWVERAIDTYHEAHSVEALQDVRLRRVRLKLCAEKLRWARGAAVGAGLPLRGANRLSRRNEVWDLVTRADVKLDVMAAEVDQMAERLEVR